MVMPGTSVGSVPQLRAGVLIGGAGARMGRPKAELTLAGEPFASRIVRVLRERVSQVVLLGDGPAPPIEPPVERMADAADLAGPLRGMLAAMRAAPDAAWIFAGCDQPLVSPAAVDWLLAQRVAGAVAVLPRVTTEHVEPLLALYEPPAAALLERFAAEGQWSPQALADAPGVSSPLIPAELRDCWLNVNTPEDLARAERIASSGA